MKPRRKSKMLVLCRVCLKRTSILPTLFAVLWTAGCGSNSEKRAERRVMKGLARLKRDYSPRIAPRIERIRQVIPEIKKRPVFRPPLFATLNPRPTPDNLIVTHLEDLEKLGERKWPRSPSIWPRVASVENTLHVAARAVMVPEKEIFNSWANADTRLEEAFERVLALRYLYVIITRRRVEPTVSGKTFTPGVFLADVLLFDLETKKLMGGYQAHATSGTGAYVSKGRPVHSLKVQLTLFVRGSVLAGLKKYLPGFEKYNLSQ